MIEGFPAPGDLEVFRESADGRVSRGLLALSAAESLTDELAEGLLQSLDFGRDDSVALIRALHYTSFVVERNSEWHFTADVRRHLSGRLLKDSDLASSVHRHLLRVAETGDPGNPGETTPRYLIDGVGAIYHRTMISPGEGLRLYSLAANEMLSGKMWLLVQLATEQQELGILSETAIEVMYLRGMLLYKEGRRYDAEPLLRRVARSPERRIEVAVALHLVGKIEAERFRTRWRAEALLRRSLEMLADLDDRFGQAQVLHTLGLLLSRGRGRREEAEVLLRRSLDIGNDMGVERHQAQVLQTLGQLVGRDWRRDAEAEGLLRQSLELETELENPIGQAQVLHVLGQLLGRSVRRAREAEGLLRRSLEILTSIDDDYGEAQVLHTLGQLLGRDSERRGEASALLGRSLRIGEVLGNKNHQAQVLRTLGRLHWHVDPAMAERLLRRSLSLNVEIGNRQGERIVRIELRNIGASDI